MHRGKEPGREKRVKLGKKTLFLLMCLFERISRLSFPATKAIKGLTVDTEGRKLSCPAARTEQDFHRELIYQSLSLGYISQDTLITPISKPLTQSS